MGVSWTIFFVTSVVLIATPGQDMILVMSRSVAQGPRAGLATAGGVSLGLVGHTILAALGLGAVLRTSQLLFAVVKLVGALYLVAIFFFAFLPQFVSPGTVRPEVSVFVLGLAFALLAFLLKACVGLSAGLLSGWLRARPVCRNGSTDQPEPSW